MSKLKKLGVMTVVLALTALAAANASAGTFTASAVGAAITGIAHSAQEFNSNGNGGGAFNRVACKDAQITGKTTAMSATIQFIEVRYDECNSFGGSASISSNSGKMNSGKVSYTLNAAGISNAVGTVDINNTITIELNGFLPCNVTVGPQNSKANVLFENLANAIIAKPAVTNINSSGSGGACGNNHTGGSFNGTSELFSSGTLGYDS